MTTPDLFTLPSAIAPEDWTPVVGMLKNDPIGEALERLAWGLPATTATRLGKLKTDGSTAVAKHSIAAPASAWLALTDAEFATLIAGGVECYATAFSVSRSRDDYARAWVSRDREAVLALIDEPGIYERPTERVRTKADAARIAAADRAAYDRCACVAQAVAA